MKLVWSGFRGENRALHPLDLPDTVGVSSINQNPVRGDLRPWKAPATVATVPAGRKTIYRMGRDVPSASQYWLSWTTNVHAVRGYAGDDTTERTYYTGDGFPKWTDNTMALASAPYPTAWRRLGVPAPASAPLLTASGGVSTTNEDRYYVYTYVTDKGEEGAQSPVSLRLVCKSDDAVAITGLLAPPSGEYSINRIRVYRTQADTAGNADVFFLREIASTLTSTTDDGRDLGEVLPTTLWAMPPEDLHHLTGMWNGMMAAITGKAVRFCVAYKPYAWPIANEAVPADATPVALATFGQNLLVLTTGRPLLVTGSSPEAMDGQPLELSEACIAPESVVSFGHGVAWACPDGLAYYGVGGAKMVTGGLMTKEDWAAINPASITGTAYEGAYMGFFTQGGIRKGFVVDPLNPTGLYFTDIPGDAVFFDDLQDELFLLDGVSIKKWNAGEALTTAAKSKVFRPPVAINFACGEIVADNYPVVVNVHMSGLLADEADRLVAAFPFLVKTSATSLRYTTSVPNAQPFRLGAGFLVQQWQLEVSTAGALQRVTLAESMRELSEV